LAYESGRLNIALNNSTKIKQENKKKKKKEKEKKQQQKTAVPIKINESNKLTRKDRGGKDKGGEN